MTSTTDASLPPTSHDLLLGLLGQQRRRGKGVEARHSRRRVQRLNEEMHLLELRDCESKRNKEITAQVFLPILVAHMKPRVCGHCIFWSAGVEDLLIQG